MRNNRIAIGCISLILGACSGQPNIKPEADRAQIRAHQVQQLKQQYRCQLSSYQSIADWLSGFFHEAALVNQVDSGKRVMPSTWVDDQINLANRYLSRNAFVGASVNSGQLVIAPLSNFERRLTVLCINEELRQLYRVAVLVEPQDVHSLPFIANIIVERSQDDRLWLYPAAGVEGIEGQNNSELQVFSVELAHDKITASPKETSKNNHED